MEYCRGVSEGWRGGVLPRGYGSEVPIEVRKAVLGEGRENWTPWANISFAELVNAEEVDWLVEGVFGVAKPGVVWLDVRSDAEIVERHLPAALRVRRCQVKMASTAALEQRAPQTTVRGRAAARPSLRPTSYL